MKTIKQRLIETQANLDAIYESLQLDSREAYHDGHHRLSTGIEGTAEKVSEASQYLAGFVSAHLEKED